jgi:predicted nucleotidyltransferase
MQELKLPDKIKDTLERFCQGLREIYGNLLSAVILYGSAASGEFIARHSNLNILIVLKDTDLLILKKAGGFLNKFSDISALFLSEDYIRSSTDIFPIEFLDMQENYAVLLGRDVLADLEIDTANLRFQCEQELKAKLITLRQAYLKAYHDRNVLNRLLFKSVNSILHILRNVLRLRGRKAPYLKADILTELALEFQIDSGILRQILQARNQQLRLSLKESERLFTGLVRELEKIVDIVDKL